MEREILDLELKLQSRKEFVEELKVKISKTEKKVINQKRKMGKYPSLGATKKNAKFQRMGAALAATENQNKLNSAFERLKRRNMIADQQYNEVKAYNAKLRYKIDNMRREKIIYERAFAELEKDLEAQRIEVEKNNQLMEADFKAKDQAELAIANTKKEFVKKQQKLQKQMQELELKAKINIESSLDDQIAAAIGQRANKKRSKDKPRSEKLKSKLKTAVFDKIHTEEDKRKMKNYGYYTNMWSKIKEETQVEEIDELVMVFLRLEQQKMTRVKEANHLVNQIRALKAQEKEMKEQREAFIRENEERMARRKAFIRSLEKDIERCEKAIGDMKGKTQAHLNVVTSLVKPLQNLYGRLTSNELRNKLDKFLPSPVYLHHNSNKDNALPSEAGNDGDVTPQQVLQWMGFIEQRTTEIVQFYQAHLSTLSKAKNPPRTPSRKVIVDDFGFQRGPTAPSGKLQEQLDASMHKIINITSNRPQRDNDAGNASSGNNEKPLSYSELKAQALHELKGLK